VQRVGVKCYISVNVWTVLPNKYRFCLIRQHSIITLNIAGSSSDAQEIPRLSWYSVLFKRILFSVRWIKFIPLHFVSARSISLSLFCVPNYVWVSEMLSSLHVFSVQFYISFFFSFSSCVLHVPHSSISLI
jgi:hypothetical protein